MEGGSFIKIVVAAVAVFVVSSEPVKKCLSEETFQRLPVRKLGNISVVPGMK